MDYESEIAEIRKGLIDNHEADGIYLRCMLHNYMYVENSEKVRQKIIRMMYENLWPQERTMSEQQFIGVMTLLSSKVYEWDKLFEDDQYEKALKIADEVIEMAHTVDQRDPDDGCFSFNEEFDNIVYLEKINDDVNVAFAILPMSEYYLRKAGCLMGLERYAEAAEVIADAKRWNPVDTEAYIADADCLFALGDMDEAWKQLRTGYSFAYRNDTLSHVYTTAGDMLLNEEKAEDAAIMFWLASWTTADEESADNLLTIIKGLGFSTDKQPSSKKIESTANKYGFSEDPQKEIACNAAELGKIAEGEKDYEGACYYYGIVYELTNIPKFGEIIEELKAKIEDEEE